MISCFVSISNFDFMLNSCNYWKFKEQIILTLGPLREKKIAPLTNQNRPVQTIFLKKLKRSNRLSLILKKTHNDKNIQNLILKYKTVRNF